MMQRAMYQFLTDIPRATAIWLGLILVAVLAMAGLIRRSGEARSGEVRSEPGGSDGDRSGRTQQLPGGQWSAERAPDQTAGGAGRRAVGSAPGARQRRPSAADRRRRRLAAEGAELSRYAAEVTVAAERAATTASRRREEWLAAQERAEAAWRAADEMDTEVRRLTAAAALPTPRTARTPSEYADRERYLHRAAMAACVRKELPVLRLSAALAHRDGWDPRRHPVEQELILRRVARDGLREAERAAAERERAAWRDAEMAASAARSLRHEAAQAAERVRQARLRLGATASRTRRGRVGRLGVSVGWTPSRPAASPS